MKKFLALFLAAVLCLSLAACGAKDNNAQTNNDDQQNNQQQGSDTPSTGDENVSTGNAVKVGFIFLHDENSTYDLNFINAAKLACEKLGVDYMTKTNIPEGQECYEAAMDLVDNGCNVVFADSFGHEDYMIQAAKKCPDVQFLPRHRHPRPHRGSG